MKKLLLSLLLIAGFTFPVSALTLAEIRTEIRVRIKDNNTTRQRYTDAQLLELINEAQRDAVNKTWVLNKSTDIPLVIGTTYYTVPTDNISLQRVTINNRRIPETSLIKLDSDSGSSAWANTYGLPQQYFQDPARTTQIGVYPWPNNSLSTGTLHIIYNCQAPDLVSDSDVPFNAELRWYPYHDTLIFYPAFRVYLIENEIERATASRQEYEAAILTMNARIGNRPDFNPSMAGTGGGR